MKRKSASTTNKIYPIISILAILALYTKIGNQQSEDDPVTISVVRDMVDKAIDHSMRGRRRSKRVGKRGETSRLTILHEKDFE